MAMLVGVCAGTVTQGGVDRKARRVGGHLSGFGMGKIRERSPGNDKSAGRWFVGIYSFITVATHRGVSVVGSTGKSF